MDTKEAGLQWEKAATGWAKWESVISNGVADATLKMLEMAEVSAGKRVLDLASGAGNQTLVAAKKVGSDGQIVANDISPTMLEHVKKNAKAKGFSNVTTLLGAVQELDISPDTFDSAICRFALMLFADPEVALAKVHEALKPNGKIAVIVFSTPECNPFFVKPMQILLRNAGKTPPVGAPGLFSLGTPDKLENLFAGNGYSNISISTEDILFKMPPANESLIMMQEAFGAYRAVISDSPEEVQKTAWQEVLGYLKTLETEECIEAPAQILIASAQKTH